MVAGQVKAAGRPSFDIERRHAAKNRQTRNQRQIMQRFSVAFCYRFAVVISDPLAARNSLRLKRDGNASRLITRGGYDWARRYPSMVEAARKYRQSRLVIGGEVIIRSADLRGGAAAGLRGRRARPTGGLDRRQRLALKREARDRRPAPKDSRNLVNGPATLPY